ncbi:MAG: sigma-70 family RNA polymerase sigma factor [Lawsonibacter sp.]|jgi:RNA polymerase sigma factor (sigma-70 family)|nr:sigma-70 family RNA polymerase sigma factor [Lawsonibacter sp.]
MRQTVSADEFETAYDTYSAAVYRLALVYLGRPADAEDVTQEAFLRLLSRAPQFADEAHQRRWLLRVTANLCKDQLRGFWRRQVAELEDTLPAAPPEEREALEAVMALPEHYRLPIHLHYYEGYSVAEIAEILKLGQSAVKMRLKRGREMLKIELEGSH